MNKTQRKHLKGMKKIFSFLYCIYNSYSTFSYDEKCSFISHIIYCWSITLLNLLPLLRLYLLDEVFFYSCFVMKGFFSVRDWSMLRKKFNQNCTSVCFFFFVDGFSNIHHIWGISGNLFWRIFHQLLKTWTWIHPDTKISLLIARDRS